MLISEMFESYQGEYPLGVRAHFIRLAGCNRRCSWCDTKYAWEDGEEMTWQEVMKICLDSSAHLTVFTGGEPFVQQEELLSCCIELVSRSREVMIETNGDFLPDEWFYNNVHLVVSPKKLEDAEKWWHKKVVLKLVVDVEDGKYWQEMVRWFKKMEKRKRKALVLLMPMTKNKDMGIGNEMRSVKVCQDLVKKITALNLDVGFTMRGQKVFGVR